MNPIDKPSVYIAVGLISGVGALVGSTMPMILGSMAQAFNFSESQLGDIMAVFNLTFTAIAIAALFFIRLINWKFTSILGIGLSVTSLLALNLVSSFWAMAILFGLLGLGIGGLYALGMVIMGDSENPDRAFGIKLGLEAFPATVLLLILPTFVIPIYGFTGLIYAMAAMCLIIGFCSGLLPARGVQHQAKPAVSADQKSSVAAWSFTTDIIPSIFSLSAGIIFFSGILATWAFLEIIGIEKGFLPSRIGWALSLGMIMSAVGGFVAAWLGRKLGRSVPMLLILVVNLASLVMLLQSTAITSFTLGVLLFTFCVNYGLAYFFGLSAEIDISGRLVVLCATTLSVGGIVGPALGGRLMEANGFEYVLLFSAICSCLAVLIYVAVVESTKRLKSYRNEYASKN
jgi:MFS family permease